MNLNDLYENREPYQQAIDRLEQRRIQDLESKMDDLHARARKALDSGDNKLFDALRQQFAKVKAERDSYYGVHNFKLDEVVDTNYTYTVYIDGNKEGTYGSQEEARAVVRRKKEQAPGRDYRIKPKARTSAASIKRFQKNRDRNLDEHGGGGGGPAQWHSYVRSHRTDEGNPNSDPWIVYLKNNPAKIKKFKTHDGAKAYVESNPECDLASFAHYVDHIKPQLNEADRGVESTIRTLMAPAYEEETGGWFGHTVSVKAPTMAALREKYHDDLNAILTQASPKLLAQAAQELKAMYGQVEEHGGGVNAMKQYVSWRKKANTERGVTKAPPPVGKGAPKERSVPKGSVHSKLDLSRGVIPSSSFHESNVEEWQNSAPGEPDQDDLIKVEGWQDFNKVEPYEVCLAGKPVKQFDYYEDARRFHDNWKKKLYAQGEKEKADKITLNPIMKEAANPAQQAAIAINMKKHHQKPKHIDEEGRVDPILIRALDRMPDGLADHNGILDAARDAYAMELGKMKMKSDYGVTQAYIPQLMDLYKQKHGLTFKEDWSINPSHQRGPRSMKSAAKKPTGPKFSGYLKGTDPAPNEYTNKGVGGCEESEEMEEGIAGNLTARSSPITEPLRQRNFVAKNAIQSGAGKHANQLKKAQAAGRKAKHKGRTLELDEMTDDEVAKIRKDAEDYAIKQMTAPKKAEPKKSFMQQVGDKQIGMVKGAWKGLTGQLEESDNFLTWAVRNSYDINDTEIYGLAKMKYTELLETKKKTLKNTNPCWKGYHPVGTKEKNGRTVPNCVPKESTELDEEFDLIESTINNLATFNNVDPEIIWEDLESLSDDELYVFAVTTPIMEDWQKANKKDKTDGMSRKAVKAYRREHPGSKLQTAVTTKPSKLKKGSKASKRRKSYCSRSKGQMKMHNISCQKTPDKAICKARRRWNCEGFENLNAMLAEAMAVTESLRPGEYYIWTVYFDDGSSKRIKVKSDEFDPYSYYAKQNKVVVNVDYDWSIQGQ